MKEDFIFNIGIFIRINGCHLKGLYEGVFFSAMGWMKIMDYFLLFMLLLSVKATKYSTGLYMLYMDP